VKNAPLATGFVGLICAL